MKSFTLLYEFISQASLSKTILRTGIESQKKERQEPGKVAGNKTQLSKKT